jgi:hypothetical protein
VRWPLKLREVAVGASAISWPDESAPGYQLIGVHARAFIREATPERIEKLLDVYDAARDLRSWALLYSPALVETDPRWQRFEAAMNGVLLTREALEALSAT